MSSPHSHPKLPAWIFIVTDLALIGAAGVIAFRSRQPLSGEAILWIVTCVGLGAIVGLVPLIVRYEAQKNETLDERQRALEALARTLSASAEQMSIAAGGLQEMADLANRNLRQAEQLPHKLQDKIAEFQAQLAAADDADKEELERELLALRTSESERLDTVSQRLAKTTAEWTKLETATHQHLTQAADTLSKLSLGTASAIGKAQAAAEQALTQARLEAARTIGDATGHAMQAIERARTEALTTFETRLSALVADVLARAAQQSRSNSPGTAVAAPAQSADADTPRATSAQAPRDLTAPRESAAPAAAMPARFATAPEPIGSASSAAIASETPSASASSAHDPSQGRGDAPVAVAAMSPDATAAKRTRKSRREDDPAANGHRNTPSDAPVADSPTASPVPASANGAGSGATAASASAASSLSSVGAPGSLSDGAQKSETQPLDDKAPEEPQPIPAERFAEITPVAPATAEPFRGHIATVRDVIPASVTRETAEPVGADAGRSARKRTGRKAAGDDEPVLGLNLDDSNGGFGSPVGERVLTSDGATRLIVTAYIGIGNRLFIRGQGAGLSWDKGVPLQFVSIGKWRWESSDVTAPVEFKLYKNDDVECAALGAQRVDPGYQQEVTATF